MAMSLQIIFIVTLLAAAAPIIKGMNRRQLDDTAATTTFGFKSPDDQIKCGGCPCDSPCDTTSPPPPPPPPPPSPLPPKIPTPIPGLECPPPPTGGGYGLASPGYTYITGPPGDLYPVNPYFSGSLRNFCVARPLVAAFGVLCMLFVY